MQKKIIIYHLYTSSIASYEAWWEFPIPSPLVWLLTLLYLVSYLEKGFPPWAPSTVCSSAPWLACEQGWFCPLQYFPPQSAALLTIHSSFLRRSASPPWQPLSPPPWPRNQVDQSCLASCGNAERRNSSLVVLPPKIGKALISKFMVAGRTGWPLISRCARCIINSFCIHVHVGKLPS